MKLVIALAAAAAFSAIAAAIYVGERMAEPTVVADPYEAGLHYDDARHAHDAAAVGPRAAPACEPSRAPCARVLGAATLTLEIAPRPVHAMAELLFTVGVSPPAAAGSGGARIALSMPGMMMGDNRVPLAPAGAGRWQGRGVIVRCPSGKRTWSADVELPPGASGQPPLRTSFTFDVAD